MQLRVLYVSAIQDNVSSADIKRLVAGAQRRNRQLDLTGALVICDGHFVQVLEGDEGAVEEMMKKIALDNRHHAVRIQLQVRTPKRLFADWSMAFIEEWRCESDVHDLLERRTPPEQFLATMTAWVEDSKLAPY